MRSLFTKYKSVIRFIVLFLGTYLVLTVFYSIYLNLSKGGNYAPDFITNLVAKQSSAVINSFGYSAEVIPHDRVPTMKLIVNGKYLAHIIEGCNSVSVIILFIAFIIAFSQRLRKTLLFILSGAVIIYTVNILRIAILAIALFNYPQYREVLHTVIFPGLIYGMVFILWMIWVRTIKVNETAKNE